MANSIRETIIQAAVTAIDAATDADVHRSRVEAFRPEQLPAVVVMPITDQPQGQVGRGFCHFDWNLRLAVDVLVAGGESDAVADPIVQKVHSAMLASGRDLGVNGVLTVRPEQVTWDMANRGESVGVVRCAYSIEYRTAIADLSAV